MPSSIRGFDTSGAAVARPARGVSRTRPWWIDVWVRMLAGKPLGTIGGVIVMAMLVAAVLAEWIAPYGYAQTSLRERFIATSAAHWLGTDELGRDLLTRLIYGARISLYVGFGAIAIGSVLATLVGMVSGYLGGRVPKQLLLASIYLGRAIAFALFMLLPVTSASAYIFSAAIGLLWLSTVPLTAGLVTLFFGARYMGMLYGIAFLSHQIGSFMGAWLGGVVYDATGSYSIMWYLGIMLGLGAAALHLPIKELASAGFHRQPA